MERAGLIGGRTARLVTLEAGAVPWLKLGMFLIGHGVLGLLLAQSRTLATLHALAVFGLGMWWGFRGRLIHVAYCGAYIVGAEVLWRMTDAGLPWEFGKYAISALFLFALVRNSRLNVPLLALLYFALLLPSVWFTITEADLISARRFLSFNLSGPLALFMSAWFFSHVTLSSREIHVLLLTLVAPIVGIFAIAAMGTIDFVGGSSGAFFTESNPNTSGGFGPNQVSSALGLGAMLLFFFLFIGRKPRVQVLLAVVLMLLFAVQSGLTFSRSGLAMAVGGGMAGAMFLMKNTRARIILCVTAVVAVFGFIWLVLPALDSLTSNAFSARFTETTTSGRLEIVLGEFMVWQENPFLGAGPGQAAVYRERLLGINMAAHTEFTRLLAEHGMLGITALVLLLLMCVGNLIRMPGYRERALVAAVITWVMLFMLVNAFRLAAPALLIGFTCAVLLANDRWKIVPGERVEPVWQDDFNP